MARNGISLEEKQRWMRDKHLAPTSAQPGTIFAERHYTVSEIAAMWALSHDAVRKIFENEPGVLVLGGSDSARKRRYLTLRIPLSVVERVHRRMTRV